jgi:hypothetical protein
MKKLLIILMVFTSCTTQKKCLEKYPPTTSTDSIYIEKIKEVPYYIKGDSILIDAPTNCDDIEPIVFENSRLKQVISILNGKLTSKTDIKPDTVIIPVKEIKEVVKTVKVPKPEKYTKLIRVLACFGASSIIALLIFVFIKLRLA